MTSLAIAQRLRTGDSEEDRPAVFIIGDSLYDCLRSKNVELVGRVGHAYRRGFRLLTRRYSDSTTFLPVVFSLLSLEQANNLLHPRHRRSALSSWCF